MQDHKPQLMSLHNSASVCINAYAHTVAFNLKPMSRSYKMCTIEGTSLSGTPPWRFWTWATQELLSGSTMLAVVLLCAWRGGCVDSSSVGLYPHNPKVMIMDSGS